MKTHDEKPHQDQMQDEATNDQRDAVVLLASAGIEVVMVYDGDADHCPQCRSQVLARAA